MLSFESSSIVYDEIITLVEHASVNSYGPLHIQIIGRINGLTMSNDGIVIFTDEAHVCCISLKDQKQYIDALFKISPFPNVLIRLVMGFIGPEVESVKVLGGTSGYIHAKNPLGFHTLRFRNPIGVAFDMYRNICVCDSENHCIRYIDRKSLSFAVIDLIGEVSKKAGKDTMKYNCACTKGYQDGNNEQAMFNAPYGIVWRESDGVTIISDKKNHCIRMMSKDGTVTTLAGVGTKCGYKDGDARQALFNQPKGICLDNKTGNILIADSGNHCIRLLTTDGQVKTIAGGGANGRKDDVEYVSFPLSSVQSLSSIQPNHNHPLSLPVSHPRNYSGSNNQEASSSLLSAQQRDSSVSTHLQTSETTARGGEESSRSGKSGARENRDGGKDEKEGKKGIGGYRDGPVTEAKFYEPEGIAIDSDRNIIVADTLNNCIRCITTDGIVKTIIQPLEQPSAVIIDPRNGNILVACLNEIKLIVAEEKTRVVLSPWFEKLIQFVEKSKNC